MSCAENYPTEVPRKDFFDMGSLLCRRGCLLCRKSQHEPGGPMSCAEDYRTDVPRKDWFEMVILLCRGGCLLLQEVPT